MRGIKYFIGAAVTIAGLFCSVSTVYANPWKFLPTRVLEIDGGAVSFQSAVIVDTSERLNNPMFQDYPTKYILPTTNESNFPVWIEAKWHEPGEKPFTSFGKLDPSKYGTFFIKIKKIAWNTPIPVDVTIYADKDKKQKLGGREVILLFHDVKEEKEAFLKSAKKVNSMSEKMAIASGRNASIPLLPGFQEMVDEGKPVEGTAADKQLTEDIRLLLWKNQSRHHWDCTHEVLKAASFDPKDSTKFKNLSDEAKRLIEDGRSKGDIAFEEWSIKSCDTITSYLVLMGKSPKGGTDVAAVKVAERSSK